MVRRLFEREVEYLWSRLARAAEMHDALRPLWSRDGDARVTRLVQSAAYAFARVKERLEDDLPELSHAIVASALPEVLRPFPSVTVVQVQDAKRARRNVVEHGTQVVESRLIEGAPCSFQTMWPVLTAPVVLADASVRTVERGTQLVVLRLESYRGIPLSKALPSRLRVFVNAREPMSGIDLVHALHASRNAIDVQARGRDGTRLFARMLPAGSARFAALEGPFALSAAPADRFASSTLLRALARCPEIFGFFDIHGLDALSLDDGRVHALELSLRLAHDVTSAASLAPADFCLDCAPAVNVFAARAVPVPIRGGVTSGAIEVLGHPGGDVLHVERARLVPDRDPDRAMDLRLWERPDTPMPYRDDDVFVRFERRPAVEGKRSDLRATLVPLDGRSRVADGLLHVDLLATDGGRTERLLPRELVRDGDAMQIVNVSRVTAPREAELVSRLPWRANAYARIPVARLAEPAALASFLELHDPGRAAAGREGVTASSLGVLRVSRRLTHRVLGDEVEHGDAVDLTLDPRSFGGPGATWLVGELIARALSERADMLRFTRTRLLNEDGQPIHDYGDRGGTRLPPPFG